MYSVKILIELNQPIDDLDKITCLIAT